MGRSALTGTYGVGNYTYATAPTFNYFAARGLPFIRLLVKWERLQPTLGGDLDPTQLGYLQQDVAYAKAAGALVSIVPAQRGAICHARKPGCQLR